MSLYAIGDFHLSFTVNKPMDVFDKRWKNHVVKIEKYWKRKVTENDTVVITGDHSWGRDLAECQADLDFIMALPGRKILLRGTKPITARKLGDDFDRAAVLALLEQNAHRAAEKTAPIPEYHTAETNRTERGKTQKIAPTGNIQRMVDRAAKRAEGKGIGYDRWAAVHNLKQMAATVAAMEQYGFTPDELDAALVSANADLHSSTAKLKPIETAIREKKDLQKQVLAYAKTRDVRDGLKKQKTDKARKAYREKHESDFIIADAAVRYFRQKGITKLPTYKSLQAEIEQLTAEKNALYNEYRANKERVRELQTMKSNLSQMHHGEPSRQKKHEQER